MAHNVIFYNPVTGHLLPSEQRYCSYCSAQVPAGGFTGPCPSVQPRPGQGRINIPLQKPWRSIDQPCPSLGGGKCPREMLVDVDEAIAAAVDIVEYWKDEVERVPPIVITRVSRGGKTTLIDLISKKLSESREYFVITISTNCDFRPHEGESWLQALIGLIAYQMVEPDAVEEGRENLFYCEEANLLSHLQHINDQGRTIVLLIDNLDTMGVPLDPDTSRFLIKNFLDKKGRFLIFSSHVQFDIDAASYVVPRSRISMLSSPHSNRTMETLPLPFCTDRTVLQNMFQTSNVTDLKITLAVGIPSLLYIMCNPSRNEKSFQDRFDEVMNHTLQYARLTEVEFQRSNLLLEVFLRAVISGKRPGVFFEVFSTPADEDQQRLRFPLPYIPIILQFLGENDGVALYDSLKTSAESVGTGRDWELVVTFALYIRSLAAKYCKKIASDESWQGPFDIATRGVKDVKVIAIPAEVTTVVQAVDFIRNTTQEAKTIYIFQLAYARFPDYDGFVSYRKEKRTARRDNLPTIHGFQCKLSRGYPRHGVVEDIAQGWFLRGGATVETASREGWTFPTVGEIEKNLLGFGLRLLHPMAWGAVPTADEFD